MPVGLQDKETHPPDSGGLLVCYVVLKRTMSVTQVGQTRYYLQYLLWEAADHQEQIHIVSQREACQACLLRGWWAFMQGIWDFLHSPTCLCPSNGLLTHQLLPRKCSAAALGFWAAVQLWPI